ncbi:MAG: ATP-binding protein [Paludibacteraceae bacterium]|nr:ATP-binding protein [Paludibacteraceae bacterium]
MNESTLLQVITEQREEVLNMNYNSLVSRFEENQFEWDSNLAQVVVGVRRCGKSTLCHKVLLEHNIKYAYVNLDDDRLYGMQTSDLNMLLKCLFNIYGTDTQYFFFDELQNVDGWHLFVNRLLRQNLHVVLTGSNAKLLSSELSTHLTGRYNEIRLYPFSFSEICEYKKISRDGISTKDSASREAELSDYLINGGLPELIKINNPHNKRNYVTGLFETIITKDIVRRYKLRDTESLHRIANHLINNNCQITDYGKLSELSGLKSNKTAQKYVEYLSQAFLVHRLQKFSFKSRERISKEKAYVIDTGFIANRENALIPENLGWRLESIVLIELLRRHRSQAEDVYYYKPTTHSKEIDFVVCRQGVVNEIIQVAYNIDDTKTYKREISSLTDGAEKLHCNKLTLIAFTDTKEIISGKYKIQAYSATNWLCMKI